jgi:hypothetical protein
MHSPLKYPAPETGKDLLYYLVTQPEAKYLEAHAEALAYLTWLKKLSAALIEKPKVGER